MTTHSGAYQKAVGVILNASTLMVVIGETGAGVGVALGTGVTVGHGVAPLVYPEPHVVPVN